MRFLLSLFVIATKSNQKGLGRHDRSAHAARLAHNGQSLHVHTIHLVFSLSCRS